MPGLRSRSRTSRSRDVSRRGKVSSRSRLEIICQCLGLVSVSGLNVSALVSVSTLDLGHLHGFSSYCYEMLLLFGAGRWYIVACDVLQRVDPNIPTVLGNRSDDAECRETRSFIVRQLVVHNSTRLQCASYETLDDWRGREVEKRNNNLLIGIGIIRIRIELTRKTSIKSTEWIEWRINWIELNLFP